MSLSTHADQNGSHVGLVVEDVSGRPGGGKFTPWSPVTRPTPLPSPRGRCPRSGCTRGRAGAADRPTRSRRATRCRGGSRPWRARVGWSLVRPPAACIMNGNGSPFSAEVVEHLGGDAVDGPCRGGARRRRGGRRRPRFGCVAAHRAACPRRVSGAAKSSNCSRYCCGQYGRSCSQERARVRVARCDDDGNIGVDGLGHGDDPPVVRRLPPYDVGTTRPRCSNRRLRAAGLDERTKGEHSWASRRTRRW